MYTTEDIKEVVLDVERAANAAFFSMDYPLLRIIIDTQKSTKLAYERLDGIEMMYQANRAFWNIGCYLKTKLARYPVVPTDFFKSISENICNRLGTTPSLAFSPENLQLCLKLVELADERWYEKVARQYRWERFVDALKECNSTTVFKKKFKKVFPTKY